jgi:hypothetical protein
MERLNIPKDDPYGKLSQKSRERLLSELRNLESKLDRFYFYGDNYVFLRNDRLTETDDHKQLRYHEGSVYRGIGRSVHSKGPRGYSHLLLRIRTTDEDFDHQLIAELQKRGIGVSEYESAKDLHSITVTLEKGESGGYYEIAAQGVPTFSVDKVKDTVDRIGKVFLQAKELVQKKGADSERLAKEMCSGTPNLPVLLYSESGSQEVADAIRNLASAYVSNLGVLDRPLISLFEAGELADSALFGEPVHAELRECVRRQVGSVFREHGGHLTVIEFSRVFHRICDAMGIPPVD